MKTLKILCFIFFVTAFAAFISAIVVFCISAVMGFLQIPKAGFFATTSLKMFFISWPVMIVTLIAGKLMSEEDFNCSQET